ncbi:MAG: pirin-like C-terminal cupin domain-containing protein [Corynebacterium variabile]|uniref:pirin-like C-terminal cupin domain-containing protein n=1 Tax=Corynebacterium variabile TaxID=1727 RepID=UPI003F91BA5C
MSTTSEAVPVEIITARDVPLGGPLAMSVHRTLPQRRRSLIGAWCFCDHYGPDHVAATGRITLEGTPVARTEIGYTGTGASTLHLVNTGDLQARLILLGGEPFAEEVVMWWNFVGRSDEETRSYREQWNDLDHAAERFGVTEGYVGHDQEGPRRLSAPVMPETPVRARTNPSPVARPGDDPYRPKDAR